MFTYRYSQPNEYHFSLDSIHFAEFVAQQFKEQYDLSNLRVLDLCAGCGVIGIELSWYLRSIKQIDFVEIQDIYTQHFYQNKALVNRPELQLQWHLLNYDCLLQDNWRGKYDLIVSNPPYFETQQGMLSPSGFKNRCRFFMDSTFEKFILSIINILAENGKAYFLLRSLKQHGCDRFPIIQKMLQDLNSISLNKIGNIRGTDVVLMERTKPLM